MPALREFARVLGDVVFPPLCVHCRGLVGAGPFRHVCGACSAHIDFAGPPHCPLCGHPFAGVVEGGRRCVHCAGLDPAFQEGRTAVLFRGPARSLLIELKYRGGLYVLEDIEAIFRQSPWVLEIARGALLVPVPLHARKLRERGFNQSELIAEALARAAGGGARPAAILRRVEDTPSQTAFGRAGRGNNLKNAFALARGAALTSSRRHVIVDDVFTTGSTINGCARVLRLAGCLNVEVVTFCHG
jgi:ComF family protein